MDTVFRPGLEIKAEVRDGRIVPAQVDVTDDERVAALIRGHDAVISCVVYHHNLRLARAAIKARTNFCDLGGNNAVVASELALDMEARAARRFRRGAGGARYTH